jgi:hypothetical protein
MWLKGRYNSRSTLGWEWTICKRYLERSSKNSNEERLWIINFQEAVSFRDMMWLVIATRLQAQHSSFRLRTSSPFRRMIHMDLFVDSTKGMRFPSCNFCLKKRLGEPAQFKTRLQFERAYQPVKTNPQLSFTQGTRVMRKLARSVTCVFGAWPSHVGANRCYGSKISKGVFIKVTIGIAEQ